MMPFRTTKMLLWLAVFLSAVALCAYAGLWFLFSRERARIESAAVSLTVLRHTRENDETLKRLLSETAEKRARAYALFVERDGAVAFLKELERTAAAAGAKLSIVQVGAREGKAASGASARGGLQTLVVAAEARGSFAHVLRFLYLVERFPRPLTLSRVSLSQGETGEWSGVFELEVLKIQ